MGPNALMELSSAPGSNGALTGLQTIGSYGYLDLGGVSLHTSGALTNNGTLVSSGAVGDTLSLGGALTNSGFILFDNRVSGVELKLNVDGDLTNVGFGSIELDLTQGSVTGNVSNAGTLIVGVFGASASLTANNFSNSGSVYVAPQAANAASASLAVNGYRQTAGSTAVDGTLMAPTVDIAGGKRLGRGIVTGNLVNGAIVAPSTAAVPNVFPSPYTIPATLTINGDYTQNADGTLVIDIASATDFSILDVSGKVSLDGTADFDFLNGYIPAPNTDFAFLKAGSVAGDFTTLEFTNLYGCTTCTFNLATLSLDMGSQAPSTTPEPGTLVLFATGLLGLGCLLRKTVVIE